jgi:hypothetical protein
LHLKEIIIKANDACKIKIKKKERKKEKEEKELGKCVCYIGVHV